MIGVNVRFLIVLSLAFGCIVLLCPGIFLVSCRVRVCTFMYVQKDQNLFSHDISNSLLCFYVVALLFGMAQQEEKLTA